MADEARLIDGIQRIARPLKDDADLDPLLDRIGDARVVLLGEAARHARLERDVGKCVSACVRECVSGFRCVGGPGSSGRKR